MYKILL